MPLALTLKQLRQRGVARTVVGLLTVAFLALLTVAAASIWLTGRTRAQTAWVVHTYEVLQTSSDVLTLALDAETSQRGFLLTGDDRYLARYAPDAAAVLARIDHLHALTIDNPRQGPRIARLKAVVAERTQTLRTNVALVKAGRREEALTSVRSGQSRAEIASIRSLTAQIQAEERRLLGLRTRAVARVNQLTMVIDLISLVLIAVVAAISIAVVRRYVEELRASRGALDDLNRGLEDTVADRTQQLTRANEEIQRFAYIVSHDLRAPLVNIMGYTAELQAAGAAFSRQVDVIIDQAPALLNPEAKLAVREDVPEAIQFIRASTSKMDRLINAILQLSRDGRKVLTPESIDMQEVMQTIAASLKHQTDERGAAIVVEPMPRLTSDRLSVEQIFGNLLDNAVKYLEPGRPGRIVVSGRAEGSWLLYEVADNGRGVAAKDHERVFELFRRAGVQNVVGEGLGLAFVRNSVRRLGGDITLESELGRGSTFRLKFPKSFAAATEDDA